MHYQKEMSFPATAQSHLLEQHIPASAVSTLHEWCLVASPVRRKVVYLSSIEQQHTDVLL